MELTVDETAELLGRSRWSVIGYLQDGKIEGRRVVNAQGQPWLVNKASAVRFKKELRKSAAERAKTKSNPALATTQASDRKSAAAGGD